MEHRAWTGGDGPRPLRECSAEERAYARKLYRAECRVWCDFWGRDGYELDVARVFWNRARHDAHATFRPRSSFERGQSM